MLITANRGQWTYYINKPTGFDENKVGKWMYFSNDSKLCREVTLKAVQTGIVSEAKYSGGVQASFSPQ